MRMLDDGPFPILAWIGPSQEQITPQTMADLAKAGFNLSLSALTPSRMLEQLDLAADAGVRLIIDLPGLRVAPGMVDAAWKDRMHDLVGQVRHHPGLYGYFVADEPRSDRRADVATAMRFLAEEDPDHIAYCNHWMVSMSYTGYRSYEELWDAYLMEAQPRMVSLDGYPFSAVSEEEWLAARAAGNACYFPRHRAKMHPHYFEMLDLLRQYSRRADVPMWHCILSRGEYSKHPLYAEGEMRFQIMVSLAYGVGGIQYFSYAHDEMLIDAHLQPTANWHIAKELNRLIRLWEPTLKTLHSIGVYHYPWNLPYTRPLDMFVLGHVNDLVVRGDAVVVGQFVDDDDWEYALIVNRTPYEPARITVHFGTDDDVLELSPSTGEWARPWPYKPREMPLTFEPGQGRLFRYRRTITLA
jgi:hypothetical protein